MTEKDFLNTGKNFNIGEFSGPLELLWELIKKKNVDIFEVDMVELANQYLEIIEHLQANDIDIASEYLVMASELIYIKARLILASPEVEEEVQEDKMRILKLIAEYQEFKNLSKELKKQEALRQNVFVKSVSDTNDFIKEKDESILEGYGTTVKLISTLRKMFERTHADKLKRIKLETFNLSPSERRTQIKELINKCQDEIIPFELLFSVPSLNHFVITLLAVLDMSRKEELILEQKEQFGYIIIKKGAMY